MTPTFKGLIVAFVSLYSISSIIYSDNTTTVTNTTPNYQSHDELKKCNKRFLYFKTYGKYPVTTIFDPGVNQVDIVLYGCRYSSKGGVYLVKDPFGISNMVPVMSINRFVDAFRQRVKRFRGFREPYISIILEEMLKTLKLMPDEEYEGVPLVDEYLAGTVMKWTLKSYEDLQGTMLYLLKQFRDKNVTPSAKKPLLLLEIAKGQEKITQSDYDFLTTYFDLLDPIDPTVKKFFKTNQVTLNDAVRDSNAAELVEQSFGEILLDWLEGENNKYKVKDMTAKATGWVIQALTFGLGIYIVKKLIENSVQENILTLVKDQLKDKCTH